MRNDGGRAETGSASADEGICATGYSIVLLTSQTHRSPGSWKTTPAQWHVGWGAVPRGSSRTLTRRVRKQDRGRASGVGGNGLLDRAAGRRRHHAAEEVREPLA